MLYVYMLYKIHVLYIMMNRGDRIYDNKFIFEIDKSNKRI